eukprot:4336689-Amphidinium_carterae.2
MFLVMYTDIKRGRLVLHNSLLGFVKLGIFNRRRKGLQYLLIPPYCFMFVSVWFQNARRRGGGGCQAARSDGAETAKLRCIVSRIVRSRQLRISKGVWVLG